MLAKSPSEFKGCGRIIGLPAPIWRPLYTMTNKGLEFPITRSRAPDWFMQVFPSTFRTRTLMLECLTDQYTSENQNPDHIYIQIERGSDGQSWDRVLPDRMFISSACVIGQHDWINVYVREPSVLRKVTLAGNMSRKDWLLVQATSFPLPVTYFVAYLASTSVRSDQEFRPWTSFPLRWICQAWIWKQSSFSDLHLGSVLLILWLAGEPSAGDVLVMAVFWIIVMVLIPSRTDDSYLNKKIQDGSEMFRTFKRDQ